MKKLLIIFLAVTAFISCKQEEKKEAFFTTGNVTIKGKIENYSKKDSISKVTLFSKDFLSYEWNEKHEATIDDNGKFEFHFSVPNQQVLFFYYKSSASLFVKPNSTLELIFNGKPEKRKEFAKTVKVTGNLAKENQLIQDYNINSTISSNYYKQYETKTSPKILYRFVDSTYKIQNKYIDNFIKEKNPPKAIKNWLMVEKRLNPIVNLLGYAIFNFRPTSNDKKFKDHFPANFLNKIEKLPIFKNSDFINGTLFTTLPNYYDAWLSTTIRDEYSIPPFINKIDSILYTKEIFKFKENPVLFKTLLFYKVNRKLKNNDIEFYNTYKKLIDSTFKNTVYEKALTKKYNTTKSLIENPILPEKTELLSFNTDNAQEIFDKIVKNANAKVIYIDNWATWCGPCKSQFKEATPKIKKEFGDAIEFVYLCHSSQKELYKPTIAQYKIQGKHYFMNDKQTKGLSKLLNIKGYPTYNIINKKGKLIHSGFEFRPSIPKTTEILEKLVNE